MLIVVVVVVVVVVWSHFAAKHSGLAKSAAMRRPRKHGCNECDPCRWQRKWLSEREGEKEASNHGRATFILAAICYTTGTENTAFIYGTGKERKASGTQSGHIRTHFLSSIYFANAESGIKGSSRR